ncbi:hypothetical protein [Clostridium sp.]|uniref:hypothetical protein n=1 Tax=Clostridium sp. TaxID=1506 RepID=UPI003D6C7E44
MSKIKKTDKYKVKIINGVKLHEKPYDWYREKKGRQTVGIVLVISFIILFILQKIFK